MTASGGWPVCGCGCGLRTGGGVQLNTSTGFSAQTGPSGAAARIAELEHEVRVWKFNARRWEDECSETRKNMARQAAGDRAALARVWGLIDHRRKTLRMEDLRAALDANLTARSSEERANPEPEGTQP